MKEKLNRASLTRWLTLLSTFVILGVVNSCERKEMLTRFELRPKTDDVQTIEYHYDEGPLSYRYTLPIGEISERHRRLLHPSVAHLMRIEPARVREYLIKNWEQIEHDEVRAMRDLLRSWIPGSILLTDWETLVQDVEVALQGEAGVDIREEFEEISDQIEALRNPEGYEQRMAERRLRLDAIRLRQIKEAEQSGGTVSYEKSTSWLIFTRPDGGKAVSLPLSELPIRLPGATLDFDGFNLLEEFFHYFGGLAEGLPPSIGFVTAPVVESASADSKYLRLFEKGDGEAFSVGGNGELGSLDYGEFGTEVAFRPIFDSFSEFINEYVDYLEKSAEETLFK